MIICIKLPYGKYIGNQYKQAGSFDGNDAYHPAVRYDRLQVPGVREFPSVDQPIISVNVSYPGANAEVIMNQITEPLEQNINGIPGIRSLSSVSSQGSSRITVEFELSVDMETAANDVRDKVSRAQRYLPRDCDPPTVAKADADATLSCKSVYKVTGAR